MFKTIKKVIGKTSNPLIIFLIAITAFLLPGCQSTSGSKAEPLLPVIENAENSNLAPQNKFVDADFEKNRQSWSEKNISNYNLVVSIMTEGFIPTPGPVLIKVREGKAVSTRLLSKPQPGSLEVYSSYETVDKIFDEIQKAPGNGLKVWVERYNKNFGYPEETSFSNGKIDGNSSVTIKKFEVVK